MKIQKAGSAYRGADLKITDRTSGADHDLFLFRNTL